MTGAHRELRRWLGPEEKDIGIETNLQKLSLPQLIYNTKDQELQRGL